MRHRALNFFLCRAIQKDFGFTAQQKDQLLGGWIGAAFFLVGAPSALLMGALAHSHNRRNLLFAVVLIGEPAPAAG